jgi:hypothetical protein
MVRTVGIKDEDETTVEKCFSPTWKGSSMKSSEAGESIK